MENEVLQQTPLTTAESLDVLIGLQQKILRSGRIRTVIIAVIGALLIAGIAYVGFQFRSVDSVLKVIETDMQALDMDEINDTIAALDKAASSLGKIDIASINATVKSLNDAARTLSEVDISALNDLVKSLQTTATALENIVNGWNSIFGR